MSKFIMALDAGTTATGVFSLMKTVKSAVWHKKNSVRCFRIQDG